MTAYRYVQWDAVMHRCAQIAQTIREKHAPGTFELVGIARGGMIPAILIAYDLDMKAGMLDIVSFSDDARGRIVDTTTFQRDTKKHLIIIDDIYDTGATADYVLEEYDNASAHFIIDKRKPEHKTEDWYIFPWDKLGQTHGQ